MPGGKLPPMSGMPGMPGMPPGGAGVPNFDPSKLDPKTLAKLTQLREQVASGKADPQASMQVLLSPDSVFSLERVFSAQTGLVPMVCAITSGAMINRIRVVRRPVLCSVY